MKRMVLAFILGLVSFFVFILSGEALGLLGAFGSLAVYFFLCQFLLSRGNPDAVRKDWRIMLALSAPSLVSIVIMSLAEDRQVVLHQGPVILLGCGFGTIVGALTASRAARRAAAPR